MKPRHHLPLLATLAFAHTATAQDVIKENNTDALNLTTSWIGGSVPGSGNVAVWDSTVTAANTTNLGGASSWQGIRIANPGGLVTINHSAATTLTLGGSGIDMSSATQNLTIGTNVTTVIGADQTWNVASGRTLQTSALTLNSGTTLTLNGGGVVGPGSPGGSGDLIIDGPWFQAWGGNNSWTGTTTLNSGVIRIIANGSGFATAGTGPLVLNGGTIASGNSTGRTIPKATTIGGNISIGGSGGSGNTVLTNAAFTFSGAVDLGGGNRTLTTVANTAFTGGVSNGTLTKSGAGEININSAATWSGPLTINQGKVGITNVNGLGGTPDISIASGGVFSLGTGFDSGTATIGNLSGAGIIDTAFGGSNATRTLRVTQTTDATFSGRMMDAGSGRVLALHKDGAATLTLTANNHTFTGATTISAGTLKIGGAGLLGGATYAGAITNNASLLFDSTANQTLSGTMTGGGALGKSNTGTLTFTGNGSGFNGVTTVTGGQLNLDGTLGGYVQISNNARLAGTGGSAGTLAMDAGSSLVLAGGATTTATTFSQGVTFDGLGQVYLEFASTPVDTTVYDVVTYGPGFLNNLSSLTPLVRGTLANDTANNKVTFTAGAAGTRTWNGGDGVWNRLGILTNWQEGDQKYFNGDTVIFGDIASDSNITLEGTLTPGGSAVTISNNTNAYTFAGSGSITGAVGLVKTGDGTLVLANGNTNTGTTTISAGVLRIGDGGTAGSLGSGAVTNNAQLVFNRSDAVSFANAVSGTGTLVKEGANTLTLSGAGDSYTGGDIEVNAGILRIGGTESSTRLFSQSQARTITVNSGGTLEFIYRNAFGAIPSTPTTKVVVDGGTVRGSAGSLGSMTILQDLTLLNGATLEATKNNSNFGTFQLQGTVTVGGSAPSAITSVTGNITVGNGSNNTGITTFDVADASADASADLTIGAVIRNSGNNGANVGGLTKTGDGTLLLTAANTYTGATLVSAGTLLVNGSLGNTAVTVNPAATIAGTGSLGGSLSFDGGAFLEVLDFNDPLAVTGTITFGSGFGIANLTGIDWDSLAVDTPYTVLSTNQTFGTGDIANFGIANAAPVGTGRYAYFQNGSLAVVVIPEPSAALLGGLGLLVLLRRRRH